MSECANCYVSVYVPDGYEFNEGDLCMSCLKDKADRLQALVDSADEPNGSLMWTSDHEKILARKEYYDAMRSREIDMSQIPESQKSFVSALLNQRDDFYTKMEEVKQENNKLRGLLAAGKGDCVYCGLPAADIAKCPHGFPGCSRMDDIVNAPEIKFEREVAELTLKISVLTKPVSDKEWDETSWLEYPEKKSREPDAVQSCDPRKDCRIRGGYRWNPTRTRQVKESGRQRRWKSSLPLRMPLHSI
jgi:hypothetical protein